MVALPGRARPQAGDAVGAGDVVEAGNAVEIGDAVEAGDADAVEVGDVVEAGDAMKDFWWWTFLAANQLLCLHPLILCLHQKCVQDRTAKNPA